MCPGMAPGFGREIDIRPGKSRFASTDEFHHFEAVTVQS
jgi:hypothetical protein